MSSRTSNKSDPEFEPVAKASDITEGALKRADLKDGTPLVIANVGGKYYAIGAICSHEEWDLSEGTLEGHHLVCAGHGAEWDLKTGTAKFDEPLQPEPIFDVKVDGDTILVSRKPKAV